MALCTERQEVILIHGQIDESTPLRTYERGVEIISLRNSDCNILVDDNSNHNKYKCRRKLN
jgi:hypothetical protein